MSLRIGVLALQGDFREHLQILNSIGIDAVAVKTQSQLESVTGLVIPGGESTTIQKLAENFGLFEPLRRAILAGLPVFGTCAGLIMLADRISGGTANQRGFGGLDIEVRRNAFGHQVDSFEVDLDFKGIDGLVHATFIRAPIVVSTGSEVEVLASLSDGRVVAVKHKNLLGISFHPEISGESRIHQYFVQMVEQNETKLS
ncbi:MAG: hypothetical protein RL174_1063 [Actinomycetota bacterium]|jgi:5'-phosphate synthase pdxT subunit